MATAATSCYIPSTSLLDSFHPALKDLDMLNELPRLPTDQTVPSYVLSRRRHAISSGGESPYNSRPRMKRRGAISYDQTDACALYIRYLGEALAQREKDIKQPQLPELPVDEFNSLSMNIKRGRRGSIHSVNPSVNFKRQRKGSIVEFMGVDDHTIAIKDRLKNVDSWDFDMFTFSRITEGRPLLHLGLNLFQKHGLLDHFKLDILKLHKFLSQVESSYHLDNLYHNSIHAADVTQALQCLISDPIIYTYLTPIEILSCLLAAMCHDLDHPGVNQTYLVNTSSYLATIHGTHSLLERHHCHTARAILRESQLLDHFSDADREEIVGLIEDLILSTDVCRHKHFMQQFEEMLVSDRCIDLTNPVERHFVLMMAIKAADISNPTRPLHISRRWSMKIMEEFFLQGDKERRLNLPISYLCDRQTTLIPKAQSGFFEFVALPLFKAWSQFVRSPLSVQLCRNVINNKEYWDDQISPSTSSDSDGETC